MKGILFTEENFGLSVLNHKTQTRRTPAAMAARINTAPDLYSLFALKTTSEGVLAFFKHQDGETFKFVKARFDTNEIVYIQEPVMILDEKEHWAAHPSILIKTDPETNRKVHVLYKYRNNTLESILGTGDLTGMEWGNKMFMSSAHARYYAKITGIRVGRLSDITYSECEEEGIMQRENGSYGLFQKDFSEIKHYGANPSAAYFGVWDEINGLNNSKTNPWSFIYDYVVHDNLEELKSLPIELFQSLRYSFNLLDRNTITLSYDLPCGLDEAMWNFRDGHPRWKDIADTLIDHSILHKVDSHFLVEHARFSYGFGNRRLPLPPRVKEYARAKLLNKAANTTNV